MDYSHQKYLEVLVSTPERDRSLEGRFIYLADKRVGKALSAIKSVAKLSDRKNYTYTEDQATQIIKALEGAVEYLKNDFSKPLDKISEKFRLK